LKPKPKEFTMQDPKLSRGYRNKNPGNIDYSPNNKWLGLASPPIEPAPVAGRARFCVFVSHQYGIRALALLLQTYQDRHGLKTVGAIINRWAPSQENNTSAYQNVVARRVGVNVNEEIDVHNADIMRKLVEAIIIHELGGNPYEPRVIQEGLALAGYASTNVRATRTTQAAVGTAAAGVGTAVSLEAVTTIAPFADRIGDLARAVGPWVVVLVVVLAASWFIWKRTKAQKELIG
jgi:hypothetical protein